MKIKQMLKILKILADEGQTVRKAFYSFNSLIIFQIKTCLKETPSLKIPEKLPQFIIFIPINLSTKETLNHED